MTEQTEWKVGQAVEVIDEFNGHNNVIITGSVEKVTKALVTITTCYGDTKVFRIKNSRQIGYQWPYSMQAVRLVAQGEFE